MKIGKRRIPRKLLFVLVPVVILLVGSAAAYGAVQFSDISGNAHEQSILNMAGRGITSGYPDGTFKPDQPVTRGQMMTFLDRFQSGIGCTDCHDSSSLLKAKQYQFSLSKHYEGEAFAEEERGQVCAGCHGSDGPKKRINAHLLPHDASIVANPQFAPINCRTCHNIHDSYTGADFSLTGGEQAVKMEYTAGTYDKGAGNLCANCHQIRNPKPTVTNTQITVALRFGPHYGIPANMLLGEGGLGVSGSPSPHYTYVEDSCVTCHMGEDKLHEFAPNVANCTSCHAGLTNFDRNGVQTQIKAMLAQAKDLLIKAKIMNAADELAVAGTYNEKVANAFWNYKMVAYDKSSGVHNPAYAKALLQYVIDTLK